MTRAQAYALSVALEAQDVGHEIVFTYDPQGAETASVTLDTSTTYSGAQLAALTNYCTQHALALSLVVAQMGVV